jgi:heme/copper-type cytochrome/quinol oxidase subunit 2
MNLAHPRTYLFVALVLAIVAIAFYRPVMAWLDKNHLADKPATASTKPIPAPQTRDIHVFTVEYKTTQAGKEVDVYRFDPGTIVVVKGEKIRLHIHGFNGKVHHFSLPQFGINGSVQKGKVATAEFEAKQTGTFELICHDHRSESQKGPMIAYVTVVNP